MAYKILTADLRSGGFDTGSQLSIQYKTDEWVEPEAGPSFVFKYLNDAIAMLPKVYGNGQIWRCRTVNLRPGKSMVAPGGLGVLAKEVRKFWKGLEPNLASWRPIVPVLPGTYLADKVMLTKRIK